MMEKKIPLPEKEEQDGGNFLGDEKFAVENTKGYDGNGKKTDDQGDQEIPHQPTFVRNA
jgi:hypothetical protein